MENRNVNLAPVMNTSDWVLSIILTCIPLVGLIMLIVWAFGGSDTNENKKNWAKATLIIQVISIVLALLVYIFFIGTAVALSR